MILRLSPFLKKIYRQRLSLGIFIFIFIAFFINTLHTQFPDEFDNIYGGFLITQGKLPYTGFFTHHNPGAYFLASLITIFSGRSFVLFRLIFAALLFIAYLLSYLLLKKRLKGDSPNFFYFYGIILALGSTFWWGQMLLSETLVGYALVPVILLIILKKINKIPFDLIDIWIVSLLTFFSIFTSLTYIYLIPMVVLITVYFYISEQKSFKFEILLPKLIKSVAIFMVPYFLFFIYLVITKSLSEFYFASIYYNVNYYIYNFPQVAGVFSHNPIRYAISIAKTTFDNYYAILTQVNSFNFSFPLTISLAIGDLALIIFFLLRRQIMLAFLIIWVIVYTNARSTPLNIAETDFHATVYVMLTVSLVSYLLFKLKEEINKNLPNFDKVLLTFLLVLVSVYWLFNSFYLSSRFLDKAYGKFMGRDPLIYDRPQVGNIINKIVTPNDYFWIGPFELQELLFVKAKIASKYYWFLPADARDNKIKSEISTEILKNRPKVIVFKKWWANFGVKPEDFNGTIVDILNQNYFQLSDLRKEGLKFKVLVANPRDFDFESEFFFDKSRREEIIKNLIDNGMIEKV